MTMTKVDLWSATHSEDELTAIATKVVAALTLPTTPTPFCLWLVGDLGAGKTTLTGELLRHLGLSSDMPVTSPTYTYMNDYQIGPKWYAHLDLYRARSHFDAEDLGLADARPFAGLFVEWPEQVPADPLLTPTHILQITSVDGGKARHYSLSQAS